MTVPNRFPTLGNSRIALVGEAPGANEVRYGSPFVGASGKHLGDLLRIAGVSMDSCFLGNVSQSQPADNNISLFEWDGEEIQSGIERLRLDLEAYRPNIVVLLGNTALKLAKDPDSNHPLIPELYRFKNKDWRGSLFTAQSGPLSGYKCMATYHPAFAMRVYEVNPLCVLDFSRARAESQTPTLTLPERNLVIASSPQDAILFLQSARRELWCLSTDIEGGLWTMSCISFSVSPNHAYIIPFIRRDHSRWWTKQDEFAILKELCLTMGDGGVPKIFQNGLYDRFVLQYAYSIPVNGNVDDTMLAGWEMNCELEKKLAVLTSVYTRQPFYKSDRKSQDDTTFYNYCGYDSSVTFEIRDTVVGGLRGTSLEHYRLNMQLLNPLLYMEIRGIRYAIATAAERRALLLTKMHEAQARLNALTGYHLPWKSWSEIDNRARSIMLTVKGDRPRKSHIEAYANYRNLSLAQSPSLADIGHLEDLCEVSLNVDSPVFKTYLYETLKLPKQYNTDHKTGKTTLAADYEALLKLSRHCQRPENKVLLVRELQIIQLAIELRALGTRAGMLGISADADSRIRCGYNLVGSETGRITCYTSPTGSGYNLQTIPKYTNTDDAPGGVLGDRDLFLADPGYWFFQCDLSGADGWTVAAYAAMLGDTTMLDDYNFGLKPAKILALMLRGINVDFGNREDIKAASRLVDGDDWDYFACKRVQHGAAYLEGEVTISRSILKDSEGKLYWEPRECGKLKSFYMTRYWGIPKWHDWLKSKIKQRPVLTAASGQVRRFYGRPDEILTKAVAYEPQANTTNATNLAMHKLWIDPDNRYETFSNTKLLIEPLHTVHDAICGQFPKDKVSWATPKIRSYFNNPLQIAGQSIVIPFEGGFGPSWGSLKEGVI